METQCEKMSMAWAMTCFSAEEAAKWMGRLTLEVQTKWLLALDELSPEMLPEEIRESWQDFSSLRIFGQPARQLGAVLMAMALRRGDSETLRLMDRLEELRPGIRSRMRSHVLFFEELQGMRDRDLQEVLRREGLHPSLLFGTSEELCAKLLRNVSRRAASDVANTLPPPEKREESVAVRQRKVAFAQVVLSLMESGDILGPAHVLTKEEGWQLLELRNEASGWLKTRSDEELASLLRDRLQWVDVAILLRLSSGAEAKLLQEVLDEASWNMLQELVEAETEATTSRGLDGLRRMCREIRRDAEKNEEE